MASVTSLAEGILPNEPSPKLYEWQIVSNHASSSDDGVEELLTTEHCVVWSRGGAVEKIYRFDVEKEPVRHALFTHFHSRDRSKTDVLTPKATVKLEEHSKAEGLGGLDLDIQDPLVLGSQPTTNSDRQSPVEENRKSHPVQSLEDNLQCQQSLNRALVVILKTQAHVFFLAGTSHIIHLPFEVDRAFSLPIGLLLQRRPSQPVVPATPTIPSAPQNSFAFEALASPKAAFSSQVHPNANCVQEKVDTNLPFLSDFNEFLLQAGDTAANATLPRLYSLTDPLADIGVVVTQRKGHFMGSMRRHQIRETIAFDTFEPTENLLYVSQFDDLGQHSSGSDKSLSALLAVTQNQENREYAVWSIERVEDRFPASGSRSLASKASDRLNRRRSSYGIGTSTGASTPVARGAATGRESFGGSRSRGSTVRDLLSEDSFNDGEDKLASHLDSALENPNAPVKSSRRVSSLLARADLSSNQDNISFSDLAGGYAPSMTARKGTSLGSYASKHGLGTELGSNYLRTRQSVGLRKSVEPAAVVESHKEGVDNDYDEDTASDNTKDPRMRHQPLGLQKEFYLTKIHTISPQEVILSQPSQMATGPRIFMLRPPAHILRGRGDENDAYLCIADNTAASLLILSIKRTLISYVERGSNVNEEALTSSKGSQHHMFRVTDTSYSRGVVDACIIRDVDCKRLLILTRGADGLDHLSLQDPWGPDMAVRLPSKLFLNDPFQIVNTLSMKQRREGGFKRILSQGPRALVSLSYGGNRETVDIVDAGGSRHRVKVQLQPRNPFVLTMIKLCDSMLSLTDQSGESFLSGWWDAMVWLSVRPDLEGDTEWTAFVIVLFSIATGFVEQRHAGTMTRTKKRKSGLLRSSSGANTNMESWEAMLVEESGVSRNVPVWMQGEAWSWILTQSKVSMTAEAAVSRKSRSLGTYIAPTLPSRKKSPFLVHCVSLAHEFRSLSSGTENQAEGSKVTSRFTDHNTQRMALATLLVGLHLYREELKLNSLASMAAHDLTPVLAQIGSWLDWPSWGFSASSYYMLESVDMDFWLFDDSPVKNVGVASPAEPFHPPSIMHFIEAANLQPPSIPFISLLDVLGYQRINEKSPTIYVSWAKELAAFTPRSVAINGLLTSRPAQSMDARVKDMTFWGWNLSVLETLPESISVIFRCAISSCQVQPPATSDSAMLNMIGRDDISIQKEENHATKPRITSAVAPLSENIRDVHSICVSTLDADAVGTHDGSAEADRQSTSYMIFKDDQRFAEAAKLLHPLHAPMAKCVAEPDWTDTDLLEAQQELAKTIAMRTLAVSPGRSCLIYSARLPILTEKYPIHGFTLSCVMKPSNTTVTADKAAYTEEKVSWAFFHAGVEAGLSIAVNAKGIDTSWILFNKPQELKNRHAGFLLALGLNGHLKSIAKWVAFKYLTPKHTMTSIGLLLGLAASYLGTMDTLITRLLSVHVTRMLPPGAAELNLSPLTQTSGIMGIGLLYCGTQHRRMSEIMLSEMENTEEDDNSSPQDSLRDEGYRLAAGFALGYVNLGRGKDLKGLHDMRIVERLLALAIGTKKVSIVHILDKATAAATVAVALIFMKTHNEILARKIDIPDTIHQFEYVRPDIFLLRTVARHLIMWNGIRFTLGWVKSQLPIVYQNKAKLVMIRTLNSDEMPFFNIIAGLCLAIGLRYAGTGIAEVRNTLCHYLDQFMRICRLPVLNYDGKLARIAVRNCQDVVALAAACVMAGTGDLYVFRRLRSLHGRVEVDVPYGSHMAAHLAIGILFLGGGTYSFGTSDLAVASLLCTFYPLFPVTVLDNKSHLQAFRHFWVLAAEARCLVVYDIDTSRLIPMPVKVTLVSGLSMTMTTPCLLPEFSTVANIRTDDPEYWSVTIDLAGRPSEYQAFRWRRGIWVRRRVAYDTHLSLFSATMQALNDAQSTRTLGRHIFEWVFRLQTFRNFDRAEQTLVLPPDIANVVYRSSSGTVVDDRLVLETGCMSSGKSERLWNLRILFAWADALGRSGGQWGWIGKEIVERLRTSLTMRKMRR
ncbi:MAG: hypothetical protein Q9195_003393 [Heterodermia aff. obscurata]